MSQGIPLKRLGEFGFLNRVQQAYDGKGSGIVQGIGDDCAVLVHPEGENMLWTVDTLVEGVHFRTDLTASDSLGWKSLAVNLSDIAAMGGQPAYALLSLGLGADMETTALDRFYQGFSAAAEEYGVKLVGGDLVRSPLGLTITVTVLGFTKGGRSLPRNRAHPDDWIVVTGPLGEAAAGLHILLARAQGSHEPPPEDISLPLIRSHCRPLPQVAEGNLLASFSQVHAAIDISDALAQDLGHICRLSQVGACIEKKRLPISPPTLEVAKHWGKSAEDWALYGGEDYQLLATVAADGIEEVERHFKKEFGRPLIRLGRITPEPGTWLETPSGEREAFDTSGYDHFLEQQQGQEKRG